MQSKKMEMVKVVKSVGLECREDNSHANKSYQKLQVNLCLCQRDISNILEQKTD